MPFAKGPDLSKLRHVLAGSPIGCGDRPGEGKGALVTGVLPKGTHFLALRTARNGQKSLRAARTRDDYLFSIREGRVEELEPRTGRAGDGWPKTPHDRGCLREFARLDPTCTRCAEIETERKHR